MHNPAGQEREHPERALNALLVGPPQRLPRVLAANRSGQTVAPGPRMAHSEHLARQAGKQARDGGLALPKRVHQLLSRRKTAAVQYAEHSLQVLTVDRSVHEWMMN